MNTYERKKIGRLQSTVENGHLKIYYHEFGNPSGFISNLEPEEALGLLQLLSRHRDDIYEAVNAKEQAQPALR
ncbi:MAG: hypothetical protein IMW89_01820 [Ktedonobacteraceae bacterium]|nr:hypothetical protein [Ktedonobacteraceae bacterium]